MKSCKCPTTLHITGLLVTEKWLQQTMTMNSALNCILIKAIDILILLWYSKLTYECQFNSHMTHKNSQRSLRPAIIASDKQWRIHKDRRGKRRPALKEKSFCATKRSGHIWYGLYFGSNSLPHNRAYAPWAPPLNPPPTGAHYFGRVLRGGWMACKQWVVWK